MKPPFEPDYPEATRRAMARWPDVPAVFGWLRLDRRARWFVRDGEVRHPGALAFLNAHYGADEDGRWFVQNGPQRAFVALDLAPWVLQLAADGSLHTHTGRRVQAPRSLVSTDGGDLCLEFELGLGSVVDRDLTAFLALLAPCEPGQTLDALLSGETQGRVRFGADTLLVTCLAQAELPQRFGFVIEPAGACMAR